MKVISNPNRKDFRENPIKNPRKTEENQLRMTAMTATTVKNNDSKLDFLKFR